MQLNSPNGITGESDKNCRKVIKNQAVTKLKAQKNEPYGITK